MDTNFLKNPLTKGECKLVFAFVLFLSVDATSATAAFDAANVGEHDVTFEGFTLSGTDAANYTLSNQPATVQNKITKKTLTITAKNNTITFGDAPANDGVTYDGFVDGDDATKLSGTLDYEYTYATNGNVGTYSITPKGLSSGNYNIEFKSGTLTVEPKEITINWTNTSLTYNAQPQQPTATASIENQNYKLPTDGSAQQDFTINPKKLTITWGATTSFQYDGIAHAPTASVSGMETSDLSGLTQSVSGGQTNVGSDYTATFELLPQAHDLSTKSAATALGQRQFLRAEM